MLFFPFVAQRSAAAGIITQWQRVVGDLGFAIRHLGMGPGCRRGSWQKKSRAAQAALEPLI